MRRRRAVGNWGGTDLRRRGGVMEAETEVGAAVVGGRKIES